MTPTGYAPPAPMSVAERSHPGGPAGRARDARPHHHGFRHGSAGRRPRRGLLAGVVEPPALERPRGLRRDVRLHRPGRHRRLSPPLHAPQLRHELGPAGRAGRARLGRHRGPGDLLGGPTTAFSDEEGDPPSPHVGHGKGWRGALAGLMRARRLAVHPPHRGAKARYARDLLGDPAVRLVDRTFVLWALAGLAEWPSAWGWR